MLTEEVKGIEISSFPPHPSVKDAHLPLRGEGFSYLMLPKKVYLQTKSTAKCRALMIYKEFSFVYLIISSTVVNARPTDVSAQP